MHRILLGTALVAGSVIAAPYVLPLVGIGSSDMALDTLAIMHGKGLGSGLAGAANTVVNALPVVGPALARGGITTAATAGRLAVGSLVLGQFFKRQPDGSSAVRWGRVLAYGTLATSALIALPSVLTGISVGIVYLAEALAGPVVASEAVAFLSRTVGAMGAMEFGAYGLSGAMVALPHLLTCGASFLPVAASSLGLARSDRAKNAEGTRTPVHAMQNAPLAEAHNGSVRCEVVTNTPTRAGQPTEAVLTLKDAHTGAPVTDAQLQTVHAHTLHMFLVDESLRDYHHIHPRPTGVPGEYRFHFTPRTNNRYAAWSECVPRGQSLPQKMLARLPAHTTRHMPARVQINSQTHQNGLNFIWRCHPPLRAGETSTIEITANDAQGKPVAFETVMDAKGHLVGFTAQDQEYLHLHPQAAQPGSLRFSVTPTQAGPMQFYLQIRQHGQDIFAPFGQRVRPPSMANRPGATALPTTPAPAAAYAR